MQTCYNNRMGYIGANGQCDDAVYDDRDRDRHDEFEICILHRADIY